MEAKMKRFNYIILLIAVAAASYFGGYAFRLHAESINTNNRLVRLIKTERRLKKYLQSKKYSGYLRIKSHYAAKLMKYAEKHKNKKFVKALAEKEQAEIRYYQDSK